jgi:DNA-3-methyladenine glycosylase I
MPRPDDAPQEPGERRYIIPPRQKPDTDSGYFAVLAQATFQAGFSWEVVRNKWPSFVKAFDGFDIDKVARYGPDDIDRLLADKGIVRNGRKIEAVIHNASVMRRLINEHGSFHAYLRTMDGLPYEKRRKLLEKQFKWLGRTGVFFFLFCVDEDVPHWEDR